MHFIDRSVWNLEQSTTFVNSSAGTGGHFRIFDPVHYQIAHLGGTFSFGTPEAWNELHTSALKNNRYPVLSEAYQMQREGFLMVTRWAGRSDLLKFLYFNDHGVENSLTHVGNIFER